MSDELAPSPILPVYSAVGFPVKPLRTDLLLLAVQGRVPGRGAGRFPPPLKGAARGGTPGRSPAAAAPEMDPGSEAAGRL